jgi:hypothetical protein
MKKGKYVKKFSADYQPTPEQKAAGYAFKKFKNKINATLLSFRLKDFLSPAEIEMLYQLYRFKYQRIQHFADIRLYDLIALNMARGASVPDPEAAMRNWAIMSKTLESSRAADFEEELRPILIMPGESKNV